VGNQLLALTLLHSDVRQDDPDDELRWDETALSKRQQVGETDLAALGIASVAGLAPSLQLNLGDGVQVAGT
jgi:hypothetical protein